MYKIRVCAVPDVSCRFFSCSNFSLSAYATKTHIIFSICTLKSVITWTFSNLFSFPFLSFPFLSFPFLSLLIFPYVLFLIILLLYLVIWCSWNTSIHFTNPSSFLPHSCSQWHINIGALAIFLAWIVLALILRKFPMVGIYIVMFEDILVTFLRFSIILALFIVAFGLSFYTILHRYLVSSSVCCSLCRAVEIIFCPLVKIYVLFAASDKVVKGSRAPMTVKKR